MTRLSDLLRMSLEDNGTQVTTLSRELEFVNGYLEIENIRFEDRLNIILDIAPDTLDAEVPHLLLQPLVENAVRHGISRLSSGGEIRIAASHDEHNLHLRVRDNGPGLGNRDGPPSKVGLGLKATRERLETLFGNAQSFEVRSPVEGGVEACVRIPFRLHQAPSTHEIVSGNSKRQTVTIRWEVRMMRTIIADDERLARKKLRILLSSEPGVEIVAECSDGKQTLAALRANKPDLLLLDIQMPDMDGFGVLRAIPAGRHASRCLHDGIRSLCCQSLRGACPGLPAETI